MTFQPDQLLHHNPDALIDRALQSLRDTHPPNGLEVRVAAHLAQAAEARDTTETRSAAFSPFAVILSIAKEPRILLTPVPFSALAATALLAITLIAVNHHQKANIIANSNPQQSIIQSQPSNPTRTSNLAKSQVPQGFSSTNTQVPQGFSLGSHRAPKEGGALAPEASTDSDTLALAETLAPSHPAPPMPLTAQEHLLLLAAQQGQPMELAELETLRQPALQAAAEARERTTIRRYAQSLLGPLAAAEALNPTSPPASADDTPTSQLPSSK